MCPWGKCPGGTCPGGFCPVTHSYLSHKNTKGFQHILSFLIFAIIEINELRCIFIMGSLEALVRSSPIALMEIDFITRPSTLLTGVQRIITGT